MGGAKPLYSYDAIFEVLKDLPIFFENGELKKASDPVWKTACRLLPGMQLKNLYIFTRQDRKNILTNLMKYLNIEYTGVPIKKPKKKPLAKRSFSKWDDFEYYDILDERNIKDDLDSIISLKKVYSKVIHRLGLVPFSVTYFHPKQVTLWNDIVNLKSTIALVVLNHLIDNVKGKLQSNNVFLYGLSVNLSNFHVFLAQMISDSIDANEIQNFLNCWLQNGAQAPLEIVLGYCQPLLDGASLSFNFCTFDQYNFRCFQYLLKESTELPPTLILIDIIGIVKIVDSWASFGNVLQTVKDFYLCSIMYLSTIDNMEEFNKTVISILTLCQSPFESTETSNRKDSLWGFLTSETIEKMNQSYISYVTSNGSKCYSYLNRRQRVVISPETQKIYNYINILKKKAYDLCDFDTETEKTANEYYCPIIIEDLTQLLVNFPSWTKLVVKKHECSSLVSYCSAKHLNSLVELTKPKRPREFLEYHLSKLQGLNKSGNTFMKNVSSSSKFCKKVFKNNHSHLNQITIKESMPDDRIEITIPQEIQSEEIDDKFLEVEPVEVSNTDDYIEEFDPEDHFEEYDPLNTVEMNEVDKDSRNYSHNNLASDEQMNSEQPILVTFKAKIYSTVNSLTEFDDFVDNVLRMKMQPGQEKLACKVFIECCKEMVVYEKFIGETARRICVNDENFVAAFEKLFTDCYSDTTSYNKHELKNISELYAQLLATDCISWKVFSVVELNEKEATADKRNFIRALLQNLIVQLGIPKLSEKFKDKKYETAFKSIFPNDATDALFAGNFFKLCGLKALGNEISQLTVYQKGKSIPSLMTYP